MMCTPVIIVSFLLLARINNCDAQKLAAQVVSTPAVVHRNSKGATELSDSFCLLQVQTYTGPPVLTDNALLAGSKVIVEPARRSVQPASGSLSLQSPSTQTAELIAQKTPVVQWFVFREWWHGLSFFFLIKAACMLSNVIFQVSPYPLMMKIRTERDTGSTDAAPLVTIMMGGFQWSFYGTFAWLVTARAGFLVIVYSNLFGVVVGAFYVATFQRHCSSSTSRDNLSMYFRIIAALVLMQICAILTQPIEHALLFSGLVSSGCSMASALSPLTVVPTVLETRSSAAMQLPMIWAALVSGTLWAVCGFIIWDLWLAVPNAVSLAVSMFLLLLASKFPRTEFVHVPLKAKLIEGAIPEIDTPLYISKVLASSGGTF